MHSEKCAERSAEKCNEKQEGFRRSMATVHRAVFVGCHNSKTKNVHN